MIALMNKINDYKKSYNSYEFAWKSDGMNKINNFEKKNYIKKSYRSYECV